VWRSIEDYYGDDFFKRIIELDYGISDENMLTKMEQ
jgi:hypothetical protein